LLSLNITVLVGAVSLVSIGDKTSFSRVAVSAVLHGRAFLSVVVTTSLVDRASSIGHGVLGHPFKGSEIVSSMTSVHVSLAGDQNLRRQVDIGPDSLTLNLNSVGEDGSSSVGPARSTVLRDVLVEDVSQEVCSVSSSLSNVVPKDLIGKVLRMEERLRDVLNNGDLGLSDVRVLAVDVSTGIDHGTEHSGNSEGLHLGLFCY